MDLYLDLEWFIGGEIFLLGYCRDRKNFGQLYEQTLTLQNVNKLLDDTSGKIYFYGPDIGILEKHFKIEIRSRFHCVNLLKVFRDNLPGLKSYKLAAIEKLYQIKRNRNEYKANIFSIFQDWRKPQVRSLVLQYNQEDVINLCKLKNIIFAQYDIEEDYLLQVKLAGAIDVVKDYIQILPCDIYRGVNTGRFSTQNKDEKLLPNITAQMVVGAKFYGDKVSLFRMKVLMAHQVKNIDYDYVTCVNNRDSVFHIARELAKGISKLNNVPFRELISNGNTKGDIAAAGKKILIVDDVIYKGRTMAAAIEAMAKVKPTTIHFLAFGKSARFAF